MAPSTPPVPPPPTSSDGGGPTVLPYGTWPSPVTPALVVSAAVSIGELHVGLEDVWWSEGRPEEAGQVQIVRGTPGGDALDVLPDGWSARSRVHEYGGGAWWLHDDTVFLVGADDQRLYRFAPGDDTEPHALTPAPTVPLGDRYADGRPTVDGRWVICVRERHGAPGTPLGERPANELVAVDAHDGGEPVVLVTGPDFVAAPRPSPDGRHLCWYQWDDPDLPWDATELWVAELTEGDAVGGVPAVGDGPLRLVHPRRVAGGPGESVVQPGWTADGRLLAVSDRSGWWSLYAVPLDGTAELEPVAVVDGDIGTPPWVFGMSRWAELADGRVVVAYSADGVDHLGVVAPGDPQVRPLASPYTALASLVAFGRGLALVGAGPAREPAVVVADVPGDGLVEPDDGEATFAELRPPRDLGLDPGWFSVPEPVTVATGDPGAGEVAHALYYPPTNPGVAGPADERPPLVVLVHGGPTSAARPQLQLAVQFWTSRGIAVADVNYRGSVGYGRAYREALDGRWGEADVEDCARVAAALADAGRVDPARLVIRGSSAGGFTVLEALCRHDVFRLGISLYGIADLEALVADTHKFEARYTDRLIGPYPERRDLYVERSPLHHVERLDAPLLVLQGLEDAVVPPAQAERIVAALRDRRVPVAYLAFEGEQHGFRRADTILRALEAERYVLAVVLGIESGSDRDVAPVVIENL